MKELIEKYLSGKCTKKEEMRIQRYFRKNSSELFTFFSLEEWSRLELQSAKITNDREYFLQNLFYRTEHPIVNKNNSLLIKCVAVVLIFLGSTLYKFFFSSVHLKKAPEINLVFSNVTDHIKSFILPDSSIAELQPYSRLFYTIKRNSNIRNIFLEGDGNFKVHKNVFSPFIVYCQNISVLALGTEFIVRSHNSNRITVFLKEGKILVRNNDSSNTQKYYVLPGNGIYFDQLSRQFTLIKNMIQTNDVNLTLKNQKGRILRSLKNSLSVSSPSMQSKSNGKSYQNIDLPSLLSLLAKQYNVKIAYPKDLAMKISFTGSLKQTDPIDKILSDIAIMNDLKLIKDSSTNKYELR